MKKFHILLLAIISLTLSSCAYLEGLSNPKQEDLSFLEKGVKIDIKKFFTGDVEAFAIMQDENEKVISTQTIKINGRWTDNKGVIQHEFVYYGGEKDSRTWLMTLNPDGTFEATGHEVAVMARGRQAGNLAQMVYTLLVPGVEGKQEAKFEDTMYLVDEKSMILISKFQKKNGEKGTYTISLKKIN